jgi:UDP-2,3-diacylglucosamine pyrophosphatase LpxH
MRSSFQERDALTERKHMIDIVVISDTHLGTFECHAKELFEYLDSIAPEILILNGDIIDLWVGNKWTWNQMHTLFIKKILELVISGTLVYYIVGNHDEGLHSLSSIGLGNFYLCNDLILDLESKKAWFVHGDGFDVVVLHAKWLAKLGAFGYSILVLLNRCINSLLASFGKERVSLSKRVKGSIKRAVQYVSDFEYAAAETAINKGYSYVICRHIHQPEIKRFAASHSEIVYMNSGDWVENLTALEYQDGVWRLFRYHEERPQ